MPVYLPGLTFGGLGYGGASYGYSPYGSGVLPRLDVPVDGGYGGAPHGLSAYGSVDIIPPRVTGAQSLDGFRVEVFFSEEMMNNAALGDPANYSFSDVFGVVLTSESVATGTSGPLGGFSSVIVTHSGSTLGGLCTLAVTGVDDLAGNEIDSSPVTLLTFGDATSVLVSFPSPDDGRTARLDFRDSRGLPQDLLTEVEFTHGVGSTDSYEISTTYPVPPTISDPTQNPALHSQVDLDVHPMTSDLYNLVIGPSRSLEYHGTNLPDDDPNFNGVSVGTGTSVASPTDGLIISKSLGDFYGWVFGDTSGRVLPNTTYRADFTVDVTSAVISPAVFNSTLVIFSVSDGAVQVNLSLGDTAGVKTIGITSGAYTASVPADWSSTEVQISLIRNQQAGFFTLLLDGVPLITFNKVLATGAPTHSAGSGVLLSTSQDVSHLKVTQVGLTASHTLFTSTWNFIHGLDTVFTGSAVLTRDRVITQRGPLVRGWGDATPAEKIDVEVRVNGVAVDISTVNPYMGWIFPTLPIPLSTPGTVSVETDYIWFSNPVFPLAGLNTPGLTLNQYDHRGNPGNSNRSPTPRPDTATGSAARNRFPMSVVLPLGNRLSPRQIGHRYLGFQKGGYSALLNEPTTLLLNQHPSAISIGGLTASSMIETGVFDGRTSPQSAGTSWGLCGVDNGGLVGDSTWRVLDDSSGPFGVGAEAIYQRDVDLSLETSVTMSSRFRLESWTPDGVFTGIGLGVHDGSQIVLVGALSISGVQHLGVLLDGEKAHLEEGWQVGPSAAAIATSQHTLEIDFDSLPAGVQSGVRFRVASGVQAGVYTISECGLSVSADGTKVEISLAGDLPGNIENAGANEFEVLFETLWSTDFLSIQIQSVFPHGGAQVYLGGQISGLIADIDNLTPFPAQTALLLPSTKKGVAFWGSVSRRAENSTLWDFIQYASNPQRLTQTSQGITAQTEMNVLPEDDPNDPWSVIGGFGYTQVDSSGDNVLIKSTSGSEDSSVDLEFSYQRVEPFISNEVITDVEGHFRVESGVLGAGDAQIQINDGIRQVQFSTLIYRQTPTTRHLITDLPQVSVSGLRDPVAEGWAKSTGNDLSDPFVRGQTLEFEKTSTQTGQWHRSLVAPTSVDYEGLIAEARVSISEGVVGTVGIGCVFGCRVQVNPTQVRPIFMSFSTGTVDLLDSSGGTIATFPHVWGDGQFHTYRLLCDPVADIAVLIINDTVIGNAAVSSFSAISGEASGIVGELGDGACKWVLDYFHTVPLRPVAHAGEVLGRTFGILLREGEDRPDDINSYRIPRADSTKAANSSTTAIPVVMDWQNFSHVRLLLDPNWGVSFYRPDLPLPPGYTGNYITEITDPTAAWATVEYSELPVRKRARGCVSFAAPDPRSITQQRWDFMRYRIRGDIDGFGIAPQNMVLNRSFTLTSPELLSDTTPEVRTFNSRTSTLAVVSDSAIFADRVFVLQVGGSVLPSSDWTFNADDQTIILSNALPTSQHPITVTFAPSRKVTREYLCSQPFSGSVTVLNEGTPPVPRSRDESSTITEVWGSALNDPDDVLDVAESLILNDPYRFTTFQDDENSLYACTDFCEVTDGGDDVHLSTLCDGPGPGLGFAEIAIEGLFTTDIHSVEEGPAGPWGRSSPVISGSSTRFPQGSILFASGGHFVKSVLGPGDAASIIYPNGRGPSGAPLGLGPGLMGMNQDSRFILSDVTPRAETFGIQSLLGDNVPPSSADPTTDPSPSGIPGATGNGAAGYTLEDTSTSPYSRLGPWSGLSDLSVRSLLAGGSPLGGSGFILSGGTPLPVTIVTTTGTIEAAN